MRDLLDISYTHPCMKQFSKEKSLSHEVICIIGKMIGYRHPIVKIVKPLCVNNLKCDKWCKVHHTKNDSHYQGVFYEYIQENSEHNIPAHYYVIIHKPELYPGDSTTYVVNMLPEHFDYFIDSYICPICNNISKNYNKSKKKMNTFGSHNLSYGKLPKTFHRSSEILIGNPFPKISNSHEICNKKNNHIDYVGYATWRYKKTNELLYFHNKHDINSIGFKFDFRNNFRNKPKLPSGTRQYRLNLQHINYKNRNLSLEDRQFIFNQYRDFEFDALLNNYQAINDDYKNKKHKYEKQRQNRMLPNVTFYSKKELYYICKNLGELSENIYIQGLTKKDLLQKIYPNLTFA